MDNAPHTRATTPEPLTFNTIVVGAGPIGIEVAAALKRNGVNYLHIEAGQIGHSITRWTPQTMFYSSPEWIALCGIPIQTADQRQIDGEGYLAYLRQLVEVLELPIRTFERVTDIASHPPDTAPAGTPRFSVTTESRRRGTQRYLAAHVVLAVGNMQRYNTIEVPGSEHAHVTYALAHPHTYFRKRLLIVGGKNSALEAALRCWRAGARVSISYRKPRITNQGVLDRIFLETGLLIKNNQITLLPSTTPTRFTPTTTTLTHGDTGRESQLDTDFVYMAIGYKPEYSLYTQVGVKLVGEERHPSHNPTTMETNIRGVYVAGTAVAGRQTRYTMFITTCHHHAQQIAAAITGRADATAAAGNYPRRNYPLTDQELE